MTDEPRNRPKVVILGTGFAGFSLLKNLKTKWFDITVVSPRNYFLFTPLLPSTTVGTIEFRSIIEPIRVARTKAHFYQACCNDIDPVKKQVHCQSSLDGHEFTLDYDYLVIGVGAVNNTLNIPGVNENTVGLRDLKDARKIRKLIIEAFERASTPGLTPEEQARLLHFVVVGGGPTGVEFAAELHDFLDEDLDRWYPNLADHVKITLVEARGNILSSFDTRLSEYAMRSMQRQKVDVRTHAMVQKVEPNTLTLADNTRIECGMILWSTGNGPTPFTQQLVFAKDRSGRLMTDTHFRVIGTDNIFAIGDCATIEGQNLPATAQVAQQQGKYLAIQFNEMQKGREVGPFTYKNMGMLAYVGDKKALADLKRVKSSGFGTYIFWRSAYLTKLVSLKNKFLVIIDWIKAAIFGRDISQF